MQSHLVIMAKLPGAGRVKTRLAQQIGTPEALRVYRTILFRTVRELSSTDRWQTWLAVAPDTSIASPVWPRGISLANQGPGDLGARMQHVFDILPTGPVVIIGSDVPGIAQSDIAAAFSALGRHQAVFGPAADGGYWLVGQPPPAKDPEAVRECTLVNQARLEGHSGQCHDRRGRTGAPDR